MSCRDETRLIEWVLRGTTCCFCTASFSSPARPQQTCFFHRKPANSSVCSESAVCVFASKTVRHIIHLQKQLIHPSNTFFCKISSTREWDVVLLCNFTAGEAFQSQHNLLVSLLSLGFSLTFFCPCVDTFHIHLPTAHPLTRPSRSFHRVTALCSFHPSFSCTQCLVVATHTHTQTHSVLHNSILERQQSRCGLSPSCWQSCA